MAQDTDRYDIFVSYATADNQGGWVTHFVDALLAEHPTLTAFFDKRAIRHGGRRAGMRRHPGFLIGQARVGALWRTGCGPNR